MDRYMVIMQHILLNIPWKTKFKVFSERKHFKAESTRWVFVYAPFFWALV